MARELARVCWRSMLQEARLGHCKFRMLLLGVFVAPCICSLGLAFSTRAPPAWWRSSAPRETMGSLPEAELLSQLATVFMPQEPVGAAFRRFKTKSCREWGASFLEPDMAAYGVLRSEEAALFIEYDGFWRHTEPSGMEADMRKNRALLRFAPPGSRIVRICHVPMGAVDGVDYIHVPTWQTDSDSALIPIVLCVLRGILDAMQDCLREQILQQLRNRLDSSTLCECAAQFVGDCKVMLPYKERFERMSSWLSGLGLSSSSAGRALASYPQLLGCSIEENLKPSVKWLKDLGLRDLQVAKAVASHPQLLGCSIEKNLKPTVKWLKDLGLRDAQVAKVVASFPQLLSCSIEENLNPKVHWLKDLGLRDLQVAKVVASIPQLLSCSMEKNLNPKVQWLKDLGLRDLQVAKVAASFPQIFCCSIENNLNPKVQWLKNLGLSDVTTAKVVASQPQLLGLNIVNNLSPKQKLLRKYFTFEEMSSIIARFPALLNYSFNRLQHRTLTLLRAGQLSGCSLISSMSNTDERFSRRFPADA